MTNRGGLSGEKMARKIVEWVEENKTMCDVCMDALGMIEV